MLQARLQDQYSAYFSRFPLLASVVDDFLAMRETMGGVEPLVTRDGGWQWGIYELSRHHAAHQAAQAAQQRQLLQQMARAPRW